MSFDFLSAVKNIAPMLAGTFGTPLLGLAVKAVCATLPDDQSQSIQDAHAADPQSGGLAKIAELFQQGAISAAQIKQAETAHSERMAELGYKNAADLAKIEADDRDSARKRQIAIRDDTPAILAYLLTAGFFGVLGSVLAFGVPQEGHDVVLVLLGSLGTAWASAMAYFFGSSTGSKTAQATLAEIAKAP